MGSEEGRHGGMVGLEGNGIIWRDGSQNSRWQNRLFKVLVGLPHRSVLSPLLFITVMEVISREIGGGLQCELLYAELQTI